MKCLLSGGKGDPGSVTIVSEAETIFKSAPEFLRGGGKPTDILKTDAPDTRIHLCLVHFSF